MGRSVAAMVCSMFLAACNRTPSAAVPPVLGLPRPGVLLVATPDRGPACGAQNFRVHFDWTVSELQPSPWYDLRVNSPTGGLLASARREGHADTGDWVHVGQWFFLVAPKTHEVVAAIRIGPDGCD